MDYVFAIIAKAGLFALVGFVVSAFIRSYRRRDRGEF